MRVGDLIRYWFARKYPVVGVVTEKHDYNLTTPIQKGTYLYSVKILKNDCTIETFDIHEGDNWEVLSEHSCG